MCTVAEVVFNSVLSGKSWELSLHVKQMVVTCELHTGAPVELRYFASRVAIALVHTAVSQHFYAFFAAISR